MKKIEFNYDAKTGTQWVGKFVPIENANPDDLTDIVEEMLEKPTVLKALRLMGCENLPQQVRQYTICLYGGNDNRSDIDENGNTTPDFSHCGKRGNCKFEGLKGLCSLPALDGVKLTRAEIEDARLLAAGKIAKEIADIKNVSIHTIRARLRNWGKKHGIRQNDIIRHTLNLGL